MKSIHSPNPFANSPINIRFQRPSQRWRSVARVCDVCSGMVARAPCMGAQSVPKRTWTPVAEYKPQPSGGWDRQRAQPLSPQCSASSPRAAHRSPAATGSPTGRRCGDPAALEGHRSGVAGRWGTATACDLPSLPSVVWGGGQGCF